MIKELFDDNITGLPSLGRCMNNVFILASKFIEYSIDNRELTNIINSLVEVVDDATFAFGLYMALIYHCAEWHTDEQNDEDDQLIFLILNQLYLIFDQNILAQQPSIVEIAYLELLEHYENEFAFEAFKRIQSSVNTILRNNQQ